MVWMRLLGRVERDIVGDGHRGRQGFPAKRRRSDPRDHAHHAIV